MTFQDLYCVLQEVVPVAGGLGGVAEGERVVCALHGGAGVWGVCGGCSLGHSRLSHGNQSGTQQSLSQIHHLENVGGDVLSS
jgi:hypothetical protein